MAKAKTYTAAEVASFMNFDEFWKEDWYYDDSIDDYFKVDKKGVFIPIDPAAKISHASLDNVGVFWQGKGADPTKGDGHSLATLVSKHLKSLTTVTVTIEIEKDKVEWMKETARLNGWKIL